MFDEGRYNWDELQEFAKENKFKSSGSKKEVIKRILAFLNEESLEPKKKKRKQSESNKKKKKKNQSSVKGKDASPDGNLPLSNHTQPMGFFLFGNVSSVLTLDSTSVHQTYKT